MDITTLRSRHSVRAFQPSPIPAALCDSLKATVTDINTHGIGLNFQLMLNDDGPLRRFNASYGVFRNARNYLACVADPNFPDWLERCGYAAEQFALRAVELGLGSCFVSGTFQRSAVGAQCRVYERVPFIVLVGEPLERKTPLLAKTLAGLTHRRKMAPRDFFEPSDGIGYEQALERRPELQLGLEAVACAPSAMNRRPVRFTMDREGTLKAKVPASPEANLIDLGIAKYNFQAVVPGVWDFGNGMAFYPEDCQ